MERLSRRDFRSILELLRALYALRSLEAYRSRLVSSLRTLISCDLVGYNEIDLERQLSVVVTDPVVPSRPDDQRVFEQFMHQHPVLRYHAASGDGRALKITDFLTQRQFRSLALYTEFFKPRVKLEYQMAIMISVPDAAVVGVACNRRRRDFNERDRACLDLLRPHLMQAYENVRAAERPDALALRRLGLSIREAEVLAWVARGKSNEDTAAILQLSRRTIEKHLERVFEKLGVETRTAAATRAWEAGSLPDGPKAAAVTARVRGPRGLAPSPPGRPWRQTGES